MKLIKYRPQRGGLVEAMREMKVFDSVDEMKQYVYESHKSLHGKAPFDIDDIELHDLHDDDDRICWKNIGYVCVKRYFDEDYISEYGTSQAVGHYSIDENSFNIGKWLNDQNDIICSACGTKYSDEILYFAKMKYCPNCGAKME